MEYLVSGGLGRNVNVLSSVKTVVDTYCHDKFKRMFVHSHRGLILLHHDGTFDSAEV